MVGIDYLSAKKSKEVVSGSKGLAGEEVFVILTACFLSLWDFFFFLLNGNLNLFAKWRRCLEMPLKNILQHKGNNQQSKIPGEAEAMRSRRVVTKEKNAFS